eukprot:382314-Rhodomonas_salina.1
MASMAAVRADYREPLRSLRRAPASARARQRLVTTHPDAHIDTHLHTDTRTEETHANNQAGSHTCAKQTAEARALEGLGAGAVGGQLT